MKATPAFVTVCILLGCSAMLNVIVLLRPKDPAPAPRGSAAVEPRPSPRAEASAPPITEEQPWVEPVRRPVAAVPAEGGGKAVPLPKGPSVRDDPAVAAVIDAQEKFNAFWKDLDQLFKAKQRLDEAKFFQATLATTMDFLEFQDAARPRFVEAARVGISGLQQARKDYDDARRALPQKDKANPAATALYDQQKNAIDDRYKAQSKAAVDGIKGLLDASRPRHAEFGSNADKWLRNLVPRPPQQP